MPAAHHSPDQGKAGSYGGTAPATSEPRLAGSYDRLSNLPPSYDPFSPENQRRMNHDAAARNGEHIPSEFEFRDLDVSARGDRPRPGFEAAIKALLSGKIETLYVAKLDRLSRKGMGHVGLILDELEKVGGRIVFVGDGLDSSQQGTRQIIGILAEKARSEADDTSWRLRQWRAYNRREGIWKAKRPFGYVVVNAKLQPHPIEAPIVRRAVDDFLDGASLRSIATRLNEERVSPPNVVIAEEAKAAGRRVKEPPTDSWSGTTVRMLLTRPVNAALISHQRRLVYDEKGEPISAGEGICTLAERARILAELERRSVVARHGSAKRIGKRTGGGRPPKFLMVGFTRCAECGGAASRQPYRYGDCFQCARKKRGQRCRGALVSMTYLEDTVVSQLRAKLAALEPGDQLLDEIAERWFTQRLPDQEGDRRVLEDGRDAARARIADLYAARYERGEFSTPEEVATYERLMQRLREQRDAAEAALAKLPPRPRFDAAELLDGELSVETWPTLPVARQRFLLGLAVRQVWIYGADVPLDERVVTVWHGDQAPEPLHRQDAGPDDGRLAVVYRYRDDVVSRPLRRYTIHRANCIKVPYRPDDAQSEAAYVGAAKVILADPAELPEFTHEAPVKPCGRCRPELPYRALRFSDDRSLRPG